MKNPGEVWARTCGTKLPSRSEALRFIDSSKSPSTVDGDLDESIKRSASNRLGDLVPQVRARTSPGVFHDMALLGLCLELSFNVLYCRTQANLPTLLQNTSKLSPKVLVYTSPRSFFRNIRLFKSQQPWKVFYPELLSFGMTFPLTSNLPRH